MPSIIGRVAVGISSGHIPSYKNKNFLFLFFRANIY